jgi:AhpD family alkylhydroperoxidase
MSEVLGFLASGVPVALTGGGEALRSLATAAAELQAGSRTSHPELFLFQSWGQVQEYAEQDAAGQDLRAMVRLVDTHGPAVIIDAVKRLSAEGHARVTVSTAHKAKGLEWGSVRIGPGFEPPPVDSTGERRALAEEEARLIYVAVTRAKLHLDTAGISWVDSYSAALSARASPAQLAGLPLTGQLRHPSSPVSRFLAAHLGDSGRVARDYLSRLRGLPPPVQPLDVQRPAWTALGHAIDLRLRVSLGGDLGAAVAAGVRAVGSCASGASSALRVAGEELLARVLGSSGLPDDELARLCFVAGYYEDVFRAGEIRRGSLLHRATDGTVLDDLLRAVPRYAIEDIGAQLALAALPFASFRALRASRRVCGPVFAGSADLGGADADFILHLLHSMVEKTRPVGGWVIELVKIRGSMLNGCAFCLDLDNRNARSARRDRTTQLPAQCLAGDRLVHRAGARRAGAQGTSGETAAVACVVRPAHRFSPASHPQADCCADHDSEEGLSSVSAPCWSLPAGACWRSAGTGPAVPRTGCCREIREEVAGEWTSSACRTFWILGQGTSASTSTSTGSHHGTLPRAPDRSSAPST